MNVKETPAYSPQDLYVKNMDTFNQVIKNSPVLQKDKKQA